jgi:hypothetical protein
MRNKDKKKGCAAKILAQQVDEDLKKELKDVKKRLKKLEKYAKEMTETIQGAL